MKKSYDYFKTLNLLSEEISVIYQKTLLKQDYSSDKIIFFAEKSQLINNLQNEFITPLERGDIFLLQENINDELISIFTLQEVINLIDFKAFGELDKISEALKSQSVIFSQLHSYKSNLKLFEKCSEEIKYLNTEKRYIEMKILDALKCKSDQPLIKYVVYTSVLDLNRCIYKTVLQIERILIDNS